MTLELLFQPGRPRSEPISVLPLLPGAGVEPLAAALLSYSGGDWRVFPTPAAGTPKHHAREWYRDLWAVLHPEERRSLVLVAGSGAIWLASVLGHAAEIFAVVREPLQALMAIDADNVPKQSQLDRLVAEDENDRLEGLAPFSNPQARALLAPWDEVDELPVTFGPPPDADRWRALLFDRQSSLRVVRRNELGTAALELARRVGCPPKRVTGIGRERAAVGEPEGRPRRRELLLSLNWLDAEVHDGAGGRVGGAAESRDEGR